MDNRVQFIFGFESIYIFLDTSILHLDKLN